MADLREQIGERTEMPTPLRLAEARRQGRVPRSGELVAAIVCLAAVVAAIAMGGGLLQAAKRLVAAMLAEAGDVSGGGSTSLTEIWSGDVASAAWALAGRAGLMLLVVVAAAVAANIAQFGLLFAGEVAEPDFARLSPVAGVGRVLSLRSLVRAALGIVKVIAVAGIAWSAVRAAMPRLISAGNLSAADWAAWTAREVLTTALWITAALLAVALVDLLYQRWQYLQDLKMTRREFLEDLRKMESTERLRRPRRRQSQGTNAWR
ncbi:MAG: EscU/YscU/HrcU family type III secretion system export apparatus switch protein [Phycisphaerae bacterium]|jgi:flagellar biosynthetic protein FlhB